MVNGNPELAATTRQTGTADDAQAARRPAQTAVPVEVNADQVALHVNVDRICRIEYVVQTHPYAQLVIIIRCR
jgi:hypothetical protein